MVRVLTLFLLFNIFIYSGEFHRFGLENGMPSDKVNHILEDREGYVWFGTDNGLVRTDGEEFKVYKKDVFSSGSIKGDFIDDLHINADGEIIAVSESRYLNIYNKDEDNFKTIDFGQELLLKKDLIIYDTLDDKEGNLWIGTNVGLFSYRIKEKKVQVIERLINYQITQLALTNNKLLLNSSKGVLEYSIKEKKIDIPEFYDDLKFKEILSLNVDENYIRVVTSDGIYSYNINKKQLIELFRAERPIRAAYNNDFNTYYFIMENKLFMGKIRKNSFVIYENKDLPKDLGQITSIIRTSNDFIWLGTDAGVYFYNLNETKFDNFLDKADEVRAYYKIGDKEFISYKNQGLFKVEKNSETKISDFAPNTITGDNEKLYFSGKGTIYSYDLSKNSIETLNSGNILKDLEINCLYLGKNVIFIGTKTGLYSINLNNKVIKEFYFDFLRQKIYNQNIQKIEKDIKNPNKLWIVLWSGALIQFDVTTKEIKQFNRISGTNSSFTDYNNAVDFVQTEKSIFIASNDAGIIVLDKKSGIINKIKNDIGENIINLFADKDGSLWFTTATRIGLLNEDFSNINFYTEKDGIGIGKINKGYFGDKDSIFITGKKGYLNFNFNHIKENIDYSKVNIEKVLFQNSQNYNDVRYKNYIFVPYTEKSFTVFFKKLNFYGGNKGEYFYKLEGQDKNWLKISSLEGIKFSNLKKGKYILRIRASSYDENLSLREDKITIYVEGNPLTSAGAFILYAFIAWIIYHYVRKYNVEGYKLAFQLELNKFATILNSSNNSKELIREFMIRSLNFLGIEDLKLKIKEDNQKYVYTYKYEESTDFVSENINKDTSIKSLKNLSNGVVFELETDIVHNIFLSRKIDGDRISFYFDVKKKFNGVFSFKDTDDRLKNDKYFYKIETMIRQFLLSYKKLLTFEELARLANYDSLTNIYNRRYFDQLVKFNIEQARRYKHKMSFAILDVDYFKKINDTYGHSVGDLILQEFVRRIKENIRDTDIFARFGGEEFVICFTETEKGSAYTVCERIREAIENEAFEVNLQNIYCTITIGISEFEEDDSLDSLMVRADQALYQGKNLGRNKVIFKK